MSTQLAELCRRWQEWATIADTSEDGWESDFPQWQSLMAAAKATMRDAKLQLAQLQQLELCWQVSEESEELAEYARAHYVDCWPLLLELAKSKNPRVRWQAYAVLPAGGTVSERALRQGLEDPDAYCRRRALLALAQLHPQDAPELRARFRQDPDPYIRQVALELK